MKGVVRRVSLYWRMKIINRKGGMPRGNTVFGVTGIYGVLDP